MNLNSPATPSSPAGAAPSLREITIRRPDDWHIHLRDGEILRKVLPHTVMQFARGIIMPNLSPPVTTVAAALAYRARVLAALPAGADFVPLMTCYLTDTTSAEEIERGFSERAWIAAKLYPAGATTNAHHGVTDLNRLAPVLERMERIGLPLLTHGESTDPAVDIFDREVRFMEDSLLPLLARHQGLKVVAEHVTTAEALDVVRAHAPRMGATITPHHLMINRNAMFQGGLRPHRYCLPVAKREHHRLALRKAATGGETCFFLGTDTAPHPRRAKEAACGCAGIFHGSIALQCYAQAFAEEGALCRLEAFAALNGAHFHGLAPNEGTVTLAERPAEPPKPLDLGEDEIVVFREGETLPWSLLR